MEAQSQRPALTTPASFTSKPVEASLKIQREPAQSCLRSMPGDTTPNSRQSEAAPSRIKLLYEALRSTPNQVKRPYRGLGILLCVLDADGEPACSYQPSNVYL